MEKKIFFKDMGWIILTLLLVAVVMIIVDPLRQYHTKRFFKIYYAEERLLNPGLAKNEEYDSIILGSSMTRNFSTKVIEDELGWKAIKLPMMSGTSYDHKKIFNIAKNNKKLKYIIYGLDLQVFDKKANEPYIKLEEYLYDDNIFNDYKYLFNGEVIIKFIPRIFIFSLLNIKKDDFERDKAYSWKEGQYKFGKTEVEKAYPQKIIVENFNKNQAIITYNKNLKDLIKENKNLEFHIFFPPYSILNYKLWKEKKILEDILELKKYIKKDLQTFNNVFIYDFQERGEIVNNLDLYMDLNHYHPSVNHWMIKEIKKQLRNK